MADTKHHCSDCTRSPATCAGCGEHRCPYHLLVEGRVGSRTETFEETWWQGPHGLTPAPHPHAVPVPQVYTQRVPVLFADLANGRTRQWYFPGVGGDEVDLYGEAWCEGHDRCKPCRDRQANERVARYRTARAEEKRCRDEAAAASAARDRRILQETHDAAMRQVRERWGPEEPIRKELARLERQRSRRGLRRPIVVPLIGGIVAMWLWFVALKYFPFDYLPGQVLEFRRRYERELATFGAPIVAALPVLAGGLWAFKTSSYRRGRLDARMAELRKRLVCGFRGCPVCKAATPGAPPWG